MSIWADDGHGPDPVPCAACGKACAEDYCDACGEAADAAQEQAERGRAGADERAAPDVEESVSGELQVTVHIAVDGDPEDELGAVEVILRREVCKVLRRLYKSALPSDPGPQFAVEESQWCHSAMRVRVERLP